jgi:Domain of unknown function (DUF4352)
MALKNCKECLNQVSTDASTCPHCGAILKRKTSCFTMGVAILLGMACLGALMDLSSNSTTSSSSSGSTTSSSIESTASEQAAPAKPAGNKEGDSVHVGYTTYAVWRSWWTHQLSDNEFLDQSPDGTYLFVELTIRNNDSQARMIPPLKLVDQNGAEYETSDHAWAVDGSIGALANLNPGISKQGFIVFDVPRKGQSYKLVLSGGYWSGETAMVELSPKSGR